MWRPVRPPYDLEISGNELQILYQPFRFVEVSQPAPPPDAGIRYARFGSFAKTSFCNTDPVMKHGARTITQFSP